MARSLPAAITAALASSSAQPSISVTSQDLQLRYSQLKSTGFAALRNAALLASSGTLIRAAVTQGADPNTVTIYRIPSPSTAGQWSNAAVATPSANAMAIAGVCLVQTGSAIRCFWIDATSKCPKYSESTNDGVTWGAAQTTLASPPATTTLCYGIMAESTTSIICSYQAYSYAACTWSQTKFSAGVWQAWSTGLGPTHTNLGNSWGPVRGLSMDATNAGRVITTGAILRYTQSGYAAAATSNTADTT